MAQLVNLFEILEYGCQYHESYENRRSEKTYTNEAM